MKASGSKALRKGVVLDLKGAGLGAHGYKARDLGSPSGFAVSSLLAGRFLGFIGV